MFEGKISRCMTVFGGCFESVVAECPHDNLMAEAGEEGTYCSVATGCKQGSAVQQAANKVVHCNNNKSDCPNTTNFHILQSFLCALETPATEAWSRTEVNCLARPGVQSLGSSPTECANAYKCFAEDYQTEHRRRAFKNVQTDHKKQAFSVRADAIKCMNHQDYHYTAELVSPKDAATFLMIKICFSLSGESQY
ncbi:hypothetical protein PROFUN_00594 [Planoprotostelium fungivorum]|uniref:Uncharacterized protein n=1 Tax=Planoprotostelium fungivorum TaxID=1890364 RepID=A0A2P6N1D0_9EUKA|nr:hypothetical protein PROFUN_00594 [Planoprotostelium fungivorum]